MKKIDAKLGLLAILALVAVSFTLVSCKKKVQEVAATEAPISTAGAEVAEEVAEETDTSLTDLEARGVFVLGLDASFPPMGFKDEDNNIVGYDIDLASEVAKRLGVEFRAQPISWDAKENELTTGQIDCIWNGFTITEDRQEALTMSFPYLDNEQVLVVKADSSIKTLEDAAGASIGVQKGSSAQEAIDSNESFKDSLGQVVYYEENVTALNDLLLGGVDGVVMDSVVASYDIKNSGKDLVLISSPLANEKYGIGFRKGDKALKDAVEKALLEMAADGTITTISTKWFGEDISVIAKE